MIMLLGGMKTRQDTEDVCVGESFPCDWNQSMGTAVPAVSLNSREVNYGVSGIVHMNYEGDWE